jgi:hypothetical protein
VSGCSSKSVRRNHAERRINRAVEYEGWDDSAPQFLHAAVALVCVTRFRARQVPRLTAYSINILGSLAGIGALLLMSYLETPPWSWVRVGALPLLWWMGRRAQPAAALALIGLASLMTAPSAWHLPVALIVIVEFSRFMCHQRIEWSTLTVTVGGLGIGVLAHPHFPQNLAFFWMQTSRFCFESRGQEKKASRWAPNSGATPQQTSAGFCFCGC